MAPPTTIPLFYRLFFLWIEPFSTAVGAYYAHFDQASYKSMTAAPMSLATRSAQGLGVTTTESIVLTQLANLYFVFAFNEALVLRSTTDTRVWQAFLLGLLIADFGHLWSVNQVGWEIYWQVWRWNAMYWGNLGFVHSDVFSERRGLGCAGRGEGGESEEMREISEIGESARLEVDVIGERVVGC